MLPFHPVLETLQGIRLPEIKQQAVKVLKWIPHFVMPDVESLLTSSATVDTLHGSLACLIPFFNIISRGMILWLDKQTSYTPISCRTVIDPIASKCLL